MEDHGTVFETRFKLMRERIEAMKEIWTRHRAKPRKGYLAVAGTSP
jgi:alkanesulfonate monooxygenase SsuD/methylene tetrahydromethanopterin reductase-like flavin-dependent oxidoreductase (luciferase family)